MAITEKAVAISISLLALDRVDGFVFYNNGPYSKRF